MRGCPPSLSSIPESLLGAKQAGTAGQAASPLARWRMLTQGQKHFRAFHLFTAAKSPCWSSCPYPAPSLSLG